MDEVFVTNRAELCGTVTALPRYSHESRGIRFFTFPLRTCRLSGTADTLNIVVRESLLPQDGLLEAGPVRVTGELRSFNNKSSPPAARTTTASRSPATCARSRCCG